MNITSLSFVFLTFVSVFIYYQINPKYRLGYLAALSCGFIASFSYALLPYVIVYSIINYLIGRSLPFAKRKKALFRIGLAFNLAQLLLLRYASFAIDPVLHFFNSEISLIKLSEIIIPIGISYFTLQGLGYLINIKMGWEKPETNYPDFLLYIVFFPKFLSGPIERSNHFLPQLKSLPEFKTYNLVEGLRIALFGFFKKVVIADQLGIMISGIHANPISHNAPELWLAILIQPLYLYFDFSGYTDIAIGISKMFGIDLLPNFNKPFLSENMTNFWKRFHITLSAWFNDFVFRQLSLRYRKRGNFGAVFALLITWTLFGIWHGAGWNFMVLGLLQAIAIIYEYLTRRQRHTIGLRIPLFWRTMISRIITFVFYGFSLIFFFSPSLESSIKFIGKLTNFSSWSFTNPIHILFYLALVFSALFLLLEYIAQDKKELYKRLEKVLDKKPIRYAIYYLSVMLILTFIGERLTFIYQVF